MGIDLQICPECQWLCIDIYIFICMNTCEYMCTSHLHIIYMYVTMYWYMSINYRYVHVYEYKFIYINTQWWGRTDSVLPERSCTLSRVVISWHISLWGQVLAGGWIFLRFGLHHNWYATVSYFFWKQLQYNHRKNVSLFILL